MKTRKILAVLILVLMSVMALGACGQEPVDIDVEEGAVLVETIEPEQIIGAWAEEIAGRGYIEISQNEDGTFAIVIDWSSSYAESYHWEMTGSIDEDKIVYSNCKKEKFVWDDEGVQQECTVISENTSGEFELTDDGKLEWDGDDEGDEGVFVKVE